MLAVVLGRLTGVGESSEAARFLTCRASNDTLVDSAYCGLTMNINRSPNMPTRYVEFSMVC